VQFAARLSLNHEAVVDNQIEPLDTKRYFLVRDAHRHFAGNTMSARAQLFLHGSHVKVL
jgi:hypothetical protein